MKYMDKVEPLMPEIKANLARLVKYNSVLGEAKEGMPFGEGPKAVLDEGLRIAEELGFRTKNVDNYCGIAEMGAEDSDKLIGIAAHLDIVPAGEGWDTDPFTMVEKDGYLYGRGVSDDKGAVIAGLYAMKILRDMGVPVEKKIRLLMGTNEETGSKCMKYYVEHEQPVTYGFTPDGGFPGIYGEKGHCGMKLSSKNTKIVNIKGGFVSNAVCNRCSTTVKAADVDAEALRAELAKTPLKSFTVTEENGELTIDAIGVSAHASTPLLGVNACAYTMVALKAAGFEDDFCDFYNDKVGTACNGEGVGLNIEDEYGDLTFNNGMIWMENGQIIGTIDIRVPVTYHPEQVRALCEGKLENEKGSLEIVHCADGLFFPPESDLVKSLHSAYVEITGDKENRPMVIGGGTYAQAVPGIIAFGCELPGEDNHIHDANEKLSVESLKIQICIYIQAILNLLAL
ncbi:MAG: Sapep family Mn(2+)-dependent dipeptidase [Clostridia bacterium]|nr:Sapep family Mn(2+)-dependent dipeptidase [Clostridia bacterium]